MPRPFGLAPLILPLAVGCASAQPPDTSVRPYTDAEIEAGRQMVELKCISCHAVHAHDRSRHPEAPPLRTLAERYPVEGLAEAFAEGIMVGHPDMPEFRFQPQEIRNLLGYLTTIQTRRGAARDSRSGG